MRKNKVFRLLLGICLLSSSATALASSHQFKRVGLILAHPKKTMQIPVINFFQSVNNVLLMDENWQTPYQDEMNKLTYPKPANINLPAISRFELKKALKEKNEKHKFITSVQRSLDTLVLDAAIIVDCTPASENLVSSCGLYYYERNSAKIIASTRQKFRVPIQDASRWATYLFQRLKTGLAQQDKIKESAMLKHLMAENQASPSKKSNVFFQLGFTGENMPIANSRLNTLSGLRLLSGFHRDSNYVSLELAYATGDKTHRTAAKTNIPSEKRALKAESYRVGPMFHTSANALKSLIWNLGMGGGLAERSYRINGDKAMQQRSLYLSVGPGIGFRFSKMFQSTLDVQYNHYFDMLEQSSDQYSGSGFKAQSYRIGFNLSSVF